MTGYPAVEAAAVTAAAGVALYAGHHLGDMICQSDRQATGKAASKRWLWPMLAHLASYHLALAAALGGLWLVGVTMSLPHVVAALAVSVASHGFVDRRWPVRWLLEHTGSAEFAARTTPVCGMFVSDQALHMACLFVGALIIGAGA